MSGVCHQSIRKGALSPTQDDRRETLRTTGRGGRTFFFFFAAPHIVGSSTPHVAKTQTSRKIAPSTHVLHTVFNGEHSNRDLRKTPPPPVNSRKFLTRFGPDYYILP